MNNGIPDLLWATFIVALWVIAAMVLTKLYNKLFP